MSTLPKVNNIKHSGLNESFDVAPRKYYGVSFSENSKGVYRTLDKSSNSKNNYKGKLDPLNVSVGYSIGDNSFDSPQSSSTRQSKGILKSQNQSYRIQNDRVGIDYFQNFALGNSKVKSVVPPPQIKTQSTLLNPKKNRIVSPESGKKMPEKTVKGFSIKNGESEMELNKILNEYNEDDNFDFGEIASEFYYRFMKIKEKDSKNPRRFQQKFAEKYLRKDSPK